eukprot:365043-Chlamydomonas_euryale.AAC.8
MRSTNSVKLICPSRQRCRPSTSRRLRRHEVDKLGKVDLPVAVNAVARQRHDGFAIMRSTNSLLVAQPLAKVAHDIPQLRRRNVPVAIAAGRRRAGARWACGEWVDVLQLAPLLGRRRSPTGRAQLFILDGSQDGRGPLAGGPRLASHDPSHARRWKRDPSCDRRATLLRTCVCPIANQALPGRGWGADGRPKRDPSATLFRTVGTPPAAW